MDVLNSTHHDHVTGRALKFTQMLTSADIPMVQNRQSYNFKNPTENYTPFPGQNVTLVLYHPPINADPPPISSEKKSYRTNIGKSDMLSVEKASHLSNSGGLTLARLSAVNMQVQGFL